MVFCREAAEHSFFSFLFNCKSGCSLSVRKCKRSLSPITHLKTYCPLIEKFYPTNYSLLRSEKCTLIRYNSSTYFQIQLSYPGTSDMFFGKIEKKREKGKPRQTVPDFIYSLLNIECFYIQKPPFDKAISWNRLCFHFHSSLTFFSVVCRQ